MKIQVQYTSVFLKSLTEGNLLNCEQLKVNTNFSIVFLHDLKKMVNQQYTILSKAGLLSGSDKVVGHLPVANKECAQKSGNCNVKIS